MTLFTAFLPRERQISDCSMDSIHLHTVWDGGLCDEQRPRSLGLCSGERGPGKRSPSAITALDRESDNQINNQPPGQAHVHDVGHEHGTLGSPGRKCSRWEGAIFKAEVAVLEGKLLSTCSADSGSMCDYKAAA